MSAKFNSLLSSSLKRFSTLFLLIFILNIHFIAGQNFNSLSHRKLNERKTGPVPNSHLSGTQT